MSSPRWRGVFLLFLVTTAVSAQDLPLRMAFGDASPPVYWNEPGQTEGGQGLLIDLMGLVARSAHLSLDSRTYPLVRTQALVQEGERDALVNVVTPARLEYAVATADPLFVGDVKIFIHKDSPLLASWHTVRSLDDLKALPITVGGLLGSGWTKTNIEGRGVRVDYSSGTASAVRKLIAQRVDAVIDIAPNIRWILKDEPGGSSIVELPLVVEKVGWHLLVSKRSPFAERLPELEQALRAAKHSPAYAAILQKWGVPAP